MRNIVARSSFSIQTSSFPSMNVYRFLADAVLVLHFVYVAFVVLGMAAILAGIVLRLAMGAELLVPHHSFPDDRRGGGRVALRHSLPVDRRGKIACGNWPAKANEPGSFIGRWMDRLLFVDVSPSVLAACYCVFGLAVLLVLMLAPPRWPKRKRIRRMQGLGAESDA